MRTLAALSIAVSLAILPCPFLSAADAPPPSASREDAARQYMQLQRHMQEQFKAGKYDLAADDCKAMAKLLPDEPSAYYNLARALAHGGKADAAMDQLALAVKHGYARPDEMKAEPEFANLRNEKATSDAFGQLLVKAGENQKNAGKTYEHGEELPGMKTVENEPAGGLRYRLRMSESASADKPQRLLIWLHPSGGSMNKQIESISPAFAKAGYALLVFTQKQFGGWTSQEAEQLVQKTLPEVAKVAGVNAERPVLFGFSAGGQIALELYYDDPSRWGGLVLDAAYPIDLAAFQRGQQTPRALPKEGVKLDQMKQVPLFVTIGEEDKGGAAMWRQVEPLWKKAGLPLRVIYVPGKGHGWLFGKAEWTQLIPWLDDVAAGKMPDAK